MTKVTDAEFRTSLLGGIRWSAESISLGGQKWAKTTQIGKNRIRSLIKIDHFLSTLKFWDVNSGIESNPL